MKRLLPSFTLALAVTSASTFVGACHRSEPTSQTETTGGTLGVSSEDRALAETIRRGLVSDPQLSMRAKTAVLDITDGVVTLRGIVADEAEHDRLVQKVVSVPGVVRLDDRLTWTK